MKSLITHVLARLRLNLAQLRLAVWQAEQYFLAVFLVCNIFLIKMN